MIWVLRATFSADLWLKKKHPLLGCQLDLMILRQEKISNSRSFLLGMPLIGMSCASRVTSRLGCRMLKSCFVWYKWTNAYENARSRWWRPTWKTIVPWEGEISLERFFFIVFVRRRKQGKKTPSFSKEVLCPTGWYVGVLSPRCAQGDHLLLLGGWHLPDSGAQNG